MKDNARYDTNNQTIFLNNEAAPGAAVFVGTSPVLTSGANSKWGFYCNRTTTIRISTKGGFKLIER